MQQLIVIIGALGSVCFLLLWLGMHRLNQPSSAEPTLARYARRVAQSSEAGMPSSSTQRRLRPLAARLGQRSTNWRPLLQLAWSSPPEHMLAWAGRTDGWQKITTEEMYGFQVMGIVVAGLFGAYVGLVLKGLPLMVVLGLAMGIAGVALPPLWLAGEANKRQRQISLALPDALELISTSVEAGLSLDGALQHVANGVSGALTEEVNRFLRELRMGMPRDESYRRLLWRNRAEELQNVIGSLLQGQELGVPVGETLRNQAEIMRERRLQRAKELGAQASPKIALITTMIIAPAVMCLFVSIVVFRLARDFGPMLRDFAGG